MGFDENTNLEDQIENLKKDINSFIKNSKEIINKTVKTNSFDYENGKIDAYYRVLELLESC